MYRITKLISSGRDILTTQDIALIWQINNPNTLYTTLKRYTQKGILFRIRKGVYSVKPLDKLSLFEVASTLIKGYNYLSCKTVLQKEGIIFQTSNQLTFISNKRSQFPLDNYIINVRQMKDEFLFNTTGISRNKNSLLIADKERAVADLLYFNKNYYFDNPKGINWKKVKSYQKLIGYQK